MYEGVTDAVIWGGRENGSMRRREREGEKERESGGGGGGG
jgi:hypothetical protein